MSNDGIVCCYYEENLPICFADENVLDILGYSSEDEFLKTSDGFFYNVIYPEDREQFGIMLSMQLEKNDGFSMEIRLKKKRDEYIWTVFSGTRYKFKHGKQRLIAACCDISSKYKNSNELDLERYNPYLSRSIKTQKNLEERYQKILSFDHLIQDKKVVSAVVFNVETGRIDGQAKNFSSIFENKIPENYMSAVTRIYEYLLPEYKEEFLAVFHINHVRKLCQEGITEHFLEYERRTEENEIGYFRGTQNFIENPYTGEVMCIFTSRDITIEKALEIIVHKIVEAESDFVTIIDVESGNIKVSINSRSGYLVPKLEENYDISLEKAMREMIVPEEIEDSIQSMKVENLVKELDKNGSYTCAFSIWNKETQRAERKIWNFTYFDDSQKEIIYSRSDITQVYEKEKQQSEALEEALLKAQQANAAKTNFLSSMSHEIRTPMNAIIGMSAIALESIENKDKLKECIAKIDTSAQFLLSLINDILDMSRIESGKMLLKSDKIWTEAFLNGIIYICYSQAAAKNIEFECVVDPMLDSFYIGDAMKLQQVLINILSNGIKFTDENGSVTFLVKVKEKTEKDVLLCFEIKDTGVGMSEEFLEHIYEPFTQENMSITSKYGGTGLGLAISKSIIDLMDGNISVISSKGKGTEFTIDVRLGTGEESQIHHIKENYSHYQEFTALIVEKNREIYENTAAVLTEMGAIFEWADSGEKAIECVQRMDEKNQAYNFILIDEKMLGSGQMETVRHIRSIVGNEMTTIIVTAFDCMSIEQKAQEAGVNHLISKPVFKTSLNAAFNKGTGEEAENKVEGSIGEYDFSGSRILLAEDNLLNTEIATYLLESKGFAVETAENGLRAVELFDEKEKGYYDAILMDIRMPVMDGLEAASHIRQLKHPDAKTIPIIAMTANAFEEDIEKSKSAGMDAHLAKPIDTEVLYQTLKGYIDK